MSIVVECDIYYLERTSKRRGSTNILSNGSLREINIVGDKDNLETYPFVKINYRLDLPTQCWGCSQLEADSVEPITRDQCRKNALRNAF